jgi:repressor LexA
MLRVRGDSMTDAGILDGDFVVARVQPTAVNGEIVVAGIPGNEATIKYFKASRNKVTLTPANERLQPIDYDSGDVTIYGRVVTVLRRL